MALFNTDDVSVDVECQHCRRKTAKKIGALKRQPKFTCPYCRKTTDVTIDDSKARRELADVERSIKNLFK